MKKLLKHFRVVNINILVYRISSKDMLGLPPIEFEIAESHDHKKRKNFVITNDAALVHRSVCFQKVNVLKLINKKGPVIGDCYTSPDYRGRGIYPFVLSHAAEKLIENGAEEVFVIVNSDNPNSIRGIEKAGFRLQASIRTKRWLAFYFDTKITTYQ